MRNPAVAGQFYPKASLELKALIQSFIDKYIKDKDDYLGCVLPHAGYEYSGSVAVHTVQHINFKDTFVILGNNHTGFGLPFGISLDDPWHTPLGDIKVDKRLCRELLMNSRHLKEDSVSHLYEHSIEVELPILQYFSTEFKIVPVTISVSEDKKLYKEIGREIADVLSVNRNTVLIASTDLTHYEPQLSAKQKDKLVIDAILELDEDRLLDEVQKHNISMCGFAPVAVLIVTLKLLGAKIGRLVEHITSGDVTRDYNSVVGYAGIIIK